MIHSYTLCHDQCSKANTFDLPHLVAQHRVFFRANAGSIASSLFVVASTGTGLLKPGIETHPNLTTAGIALTFYYAIENAHFQ